MSDVLSRIESITSSLEQLTGSQEYQGWKKMRNTLSHRETPRRLIARGGDQDGSTVWGEDVTIDANTTASRCEWLAKTIGDLPEAVDAFTAAKFVSV